MKNPACSTLLLLVVVVGGYAADLSFPTGGAKAIMGPDPIQPIEEHQMVIRAKPRWEMENDFKWLVLPLSGNETAKVYYPSRNARRTLPDEELTFTLWQTKEVIWHTDDGQYGYQWYTTLDSVKGAKKVYYDAAKCPVHRITMERTDLDIHYGLLAMDRRESKKFSGGPGWVGGGCVIMEGAPMKQRGYRCERCVSAYQKWAEQEQKESERLRLKEQKAGN